MIGSGPKASVSNAYITFDAIEQKVFEEVVFSIQKRLTIGSSATVNIVFDPTGCRGFIRYMPFLPVTFKAYGAGPITVDLYRDPTYSAGTDLEPHNRDFTSSNASKSVWTVGSTISDT